MHLEGFDILPRVLLGVCGGAFVVLLVLTGWRLVALRGAVVEDFTDTRRGSGSSRSWPAPTSSGCASALWPFTRRPRWCWWSRGWPGWLSATWCRGPQSWSAGTPRTRDRQRHLVHLGGGQSVRCGGGGHHRAGLRPGATRARRAVPCGDHVLVGRCVPARRGLAAGVVAADALPVRSRGADPAVLGLDGRPAITALAGARIVEMADAPMVAVTRGGALVGPQPLGDPGETSRNTSRTTNVRRCGRLSGNGGSAASRAAQPGESSAIRSRLSLAGVCSPSAALSVSAGDWSASFPPGPCWWAA